MPLILLMKFAKRYFDIGAWKSPEPDGFHAGFYHDNWDIIGRDVTEVCLSVLNGSTSSEALNATHIVLIPKVKTQPQKRLLTLGRLVFVT